MRNLRPIEVKKCSICGEDFDVINLDTVFTERKHYICQKCRNNGNRQIDARQKDWRKSSRGKAVIEHCKKNK